VTARVLVVEDEPVLASFLVSGLRDHDLLVDLALDGATAALKADSIPYDVVVLDRDLPVLHGDDVLRAMRRSGRAARVLMLTASSTLEDTIEGLRLGADDYLAKPFAFAELVARIEALARRVAPASPEIAQWGGITVDRQRHEVRRNGNPVSLTRKEFAVLDLLVRSEGRLVSAEDMLDRVWDERADPFSNAVRTVIKNLRRKLGPPDPIATVVGR
jgi:DNA-binding response OmpR family regulator